MPRGKVHGEACLSRETKREDEERRRRDSPGVVGLWEEIGYDTKRCLSFMKPKRTPQIRFYIEMKPSIVRGCDA